MLSRSPLNTLCVPAFGAGQSIFLAQSICIKQRTQERRFKWTCMHRLWFDVAGETPTSVLQTAVEAFSFYQCMSLRHFSVCDLPYSKQKRKREAVFIFFFLQYNFKWNVEKMSQVCHWASAHYYLHVLPVLKKGLYKRIFNFSVV